MLIPTDNQVKTNGHDRLFTLIALEGHHRVVVRAQDLGIEVCGSDLIELPQEYSRFTQQWTGTLPDSFNWESWTDNSSFTIWPALWKYKC